MLNPFPIQFLAPLSYFLLRVALGFLIIKFGTKNLKTEQKTFSTMFLGTTEIIVGTLFVLGLYTQIAAIATLILATPMVFRAQPTLRAFPTNRTAAFLIFMIALSLFVTGAGAFAFDLPI